MDKPNPAPALGKIEFSAPASASFIESRSGQEGAVKPSTRKESHYVLESSDIIAFGILLLALASAMIAIMVAEAFVDGKVNGGDALKIISACVGGSTISGIVAALTTIRASKKS